MSYVNQDTLKSFVAKNSWLTANTEPDGLAEAILQADDIIYQYLHVSTPDNPAEAPGILRNIACAIIIWFSTGQQGKLEDSEYNRRKDQFTWAMDTLKMIKDGDITLLNSSGASVVNTKPQSFFTSDSDRIDKL